MKGQKLTVEQHATIERVWLETANASEAGRQAGCSEASARRHIIRRGLTKADELYAQALAREERLHVAAVRKACRKVLDKLATAKSGKDIAALARAANDALRSINATRVAHLKATGLSAPDKVDHTSGGEKLKVYVPVEKEP